MTRDDKTNDPPSLKRPPFSLSLELSALSYSPLYPDNPVDPVLMLFLK